MTMKLSPNLRQYSTATSEAARIEAETARLDAVLEVARKTSEAIAKAKKALLA